MGKESENSYQKLKRSRWTGTRTHTQKQNRNILTDTAVFLNQKRANVYDHMKNMVFIIVLKIFIDKENNFHVNELKKRTYLHLVNF